MVILLLLCICMIVSYLWWRESKDEEPDGNTSPQIPNMSSLYELFSEQTDLNHAAFAARKALIEEALRRSSMNNAQFHDRLNSFSK